MRNGLTLRATLVLVMLAFGATSAIQSLLGGRASAGKLPVVAGTGFVAATPGPSVDASLAAVEQVPALRNPRRKRPAVRRVVAPAPTVVPTPTATASPTPTPTPTPIPTAAATPLAAPRYIPPAPSPKPAEPTPAPTSAPEDTGEFDTTGEPGPTAEP